MHLTAYLESNQETAAAFARRIGVSSVAVHRYLHRQRIPSPEVMARIAKATSGQVSPGDFYILPEESEPRSAS